MPIAKLPTSYKGWAATVVASLVGFVSGFITLRILGDVLK